MRFLSLFSGIEAASAAWAPLGWTCVAISDIDKFAEEVLRHRHPDGPRYKAIGNSMAVPVIEWIGRRIENAVLFGE